MECATGRGLAHVALPRDQWLTGAAPLTSLTDAPPVWRIWTSLGLDNHPPLYFILLRLWRDALGDSDTVVRLLSVVISLAGIALFYDALRLSLGRPAAIWGAVLAAVAMSQIHYAQEARGYTLAGALGMAACGALVRIETLGCNPRRLAGLTTATLAMLLTHYFAIAGAAALGLYALIALKGRLRTAAVSALLLVGVLFAIVWGPFLIEQRKSLAVNNAWQRESPGGHLTRTVARTATLPTRWCSELLATESPWIAGTIGIAGYGWVALRFRDRRRLWCLWMMWPVVLVCAVDLRNSSRLLESLRYTLAGSWGLFAVLAPGKPRWPGHVLAGLLTIACAASLPYVYSASQDWRVLGGFLESNVSKDDVMIYSSDGWDDWYAGALYLGVSHYARPLPAPLVLLTKPPQAEIALRMRARRVVWLITGSQAPADQIVPGMVVEESAVFPDIGKVWKLRPAEPL